MKYRFLLLILPAVALLSSFFAVAQMGPGTPGTVNPDGSVTIVIPAEVAAACVVQGGCALASRDWILDQIAAACGTRL